MYSYGVAPRRPLLPLKKTEGETFTLALPEFLNLKRNLLGSRDFSPIVTKTRKLDKGPDLGGRAFRVVVPDLSSHQI
jgi:hypothetical protein